MLCLVLAWFRNYTTLIANARRKSQEPGTSERNEQEYVCFIVSLLLTIGSSPPRACSVGIIQASHACDPGSTPGMRISFWTVCQINLLALHMLATRHDIIFVLGANSILSFWSWHSFFDGVACWLRQSRPMKIEFTTLGLWVGPTHYQLRFQRSADSAATGLHDILGPAQTIVSKIDAEPCVTWSNLSYVLRQAPKS